MPTPGTVEFPTALDGVVSLFEVNNRAFSTLSADINNSVLAIPLTDSTVFPTTGVVTLTDSLTAPTKHEEVIFTANAANSLTVPVSGRGAFGSSAQNWSGTVYVRMRMIAEHHEVVRDVVIQLETKVGYGAATPTNGKFLVGNTTAGTSTWRVLATGDIPDLSGTYQPLDSDLTAIAALSPSNDDIIQRKAGAWTNRTMAQLKSDLSLNNVENTALSTWAGSTNITTLGTIAAGTWNGSVVGSSYGGAGSVNGILKANGSGVVSAASAGTDYLGVTAPGSSGQLLYNNGNAYAAVAGSVYSASADHSLSFTPTASKTGVLIYEPTSTAPATVRLAQSLVHLHVLNGISYWALGYSSDATAFEWANYLNDDGSLLFSVSDGVTSGEIFLYPQGLEFSTPFGGSYYGGMAGVSADQYGLMLTTNTPTDGAVFPLTWRTTGITQAAPATALADGSVPVNHAHFYQNETTNLFGLKWKESDGTVHTATIASSASVSGTNTGDQTITLTGDVTGSGTGSFAATIANDAVTYAKIQNVTDNRLLGRSAGSSGDVQEISIGSGLTLSGGTLSASGASNPFDDATAIIKGSADATKLLRIEVDGLTTATTRVWTAPDANLTVAGIDLAQTWTANQTFGSGILRATSPQITTGINDSNGNELFLFTATGSAVNEITVANAATGNAPTISATGGDTNIGLTISAKGSGSVSFNYGSGGTFALASGQVTSNQPVFANNFRCASGTQYLISNGADYGAGVARTGNAIRITNGSTGAGSLVIGTSTVGSIGTSGVGVLAIANGTAPSSSPADEFQLYSADWNGAGTAAAHFRNEEGHIIKIARAATYTPTNVSTDRSYDANATTLDELADVVGTLIADLQTLGFLG